MSPLARIETASFALELDGSGRLASLAGPFGREVLRAPAELFSLALESGEEVPASVFAWTCERDGEGCTRLSGSAAGFAAEVTLVPTGAAVSLRIRLRNGSRKRCRALSFLALGRLALPGWRASVPYSSGWLTDAGRLPVGDRIEIAYPVWLAMQWLEAFGGGLGVYLGVHDALAWRKLLAVANVDGDPGLLVTFPDLELLPGEEYTAPPLVVSVHAGDWHEGARLYRDWLLTWAHLPEPPAWVQELPGWAWVGMKEQHAERPTRTFADLPAVSRSTGAVGMPTIQVASYFEHGHDTHYPLYVAGDCLGGEGGLLEAMEAIRAAGRRVSLYTNGRLMDPASPLLVGRDWRRWCVAAAQPGEGTDWDPDGRLVKETYGSVTFAVGCPSCREWADLLLERLAYVVEAYRPDGLYVDQVCCGVSLPCYAPGHDHGKPYEAWGGYIALMRRLRAAVKAANPDCYIATEGVCDAFGQFLDVYQVHNDWPGPVGERGIPEPAILRYTLPWQLGAFGPCYEHDGRLLAIANAGASGFDMWTVAPGEEDTPYHQRLARVLALHRELGADPALRGNVLRTPRSSSEHLKTLALMGEGRVVVTGGWFPHPDPDAPAPQALTLELQVPSRPVAARVRFDDGEEEPLEIQAEPSAYGELVRFTLPFAPVFLVEMEL